MPAVFHNSNQRQLEPCAAAATQSKGNTGTHTHTRTHLHTVMSDVSAHRMLQHWYMNMHILLRFMYTHISVSVSSGCDMVRPINNPTKISDRHTHTHAHARAC